MYRSQFGFLSAAVGVVVLVFFVGIFFLQRSFLPANISKVPDTAEPSPSLEANFVNKTKHLNPSPVSGTLSPSAAPTNSINSSSSPSVSTSQSTTSSSPTPSASAVGRFIKILTPNGGERYRVGDAITISWEYADVATCVIVYLLEDGTKSGLFIPVDPKNKSYSLPLLSDYLGMVDEVRVKVAMDCTSTSQESAADQSDAFFTISK